MVSGNKAKFYTSAVQALILVSSPLTASSTVKYANTKSGCLTTEWLLWLQKAEVTVVMQSLFWKPYDNPQNICEESVQLHFKNVIKTGDVQWLLCLQNRSCYCVQAGKTPYTYSVLLCPQDLDCKVVWEVSSPVVLCNQQYT